MYKAAKFGEFDSCLESDWKKEILPHLFLF